jgi:hypothetical protein
MPFSIEIISGWKYFILVKTRMGFTESPSFQPGIVYIQYKNEYTEHMFPYMMAGNELPILSHIQQYLIIG